MPHPVRGIVFGVLLPACLLSGCAAGYGKRTWWRDSGYADRRIDERTFSVTYHGGAEMSSAEVERHLLRRCAEVTVASGYESFLMTSSKVIEESVPISVSGSSTAHSSGTATREGDGWQMTSTTTTEERPGYVYYERRQVGTAVVEMFPGRTPPEAPEALDARQVILRLSGG